jgi:hypothetical protein
MKAKLHPVGLNELLGRPVDVGTRPANFFNLLRHDQLDFLLVRSGPTPELTGREASREASNLADDIQADSAPVE